MAFPAVAKQERLLTQEGHYESKMAVRDAVRAMPDGEYHWQRLQGLVYGRFIMQAILFDGVKEFFFDARNMERVELYIVSHKTQLAHHDPQKTCLRTSALHFLEKHGFFTTLQLPYEHVFFEDTQEQKIARIRDIGCDIFVDDLPEILLAPTFPVACRSILLSSTPEEGLMHFPSWHHIRQHLIP